MKELVLEALTDNFKKVIEFIDEQLQDTACPPKKKMQINLAVEEIFVNIAHYAYGSETGMAKIVSELDPAGTMLTIIFIDQGIPFNPLQKEDPNTNLSPDDRQIGGLGIFLVKKLMNEVDYKYYEGCNILTIKKDIT